MAEDSQPESLAVGWTRGIVRVAPFDNETSDPPLNAFADRLTDDLVAQLTNTPSAVEGIPANRLGCRTDSRLVASISPSVATRDRAARFRCPAVRGGAGGLAWQRAVERKVPCGAQFAACDGAMARDTAPQRMQVPAHHEGCEKRLGCRNRPAL